MKRMLTLFAGIITAFSLFAQAPGHVSGEILIQFQSNTNSFLFQKGLEKSAANSTDCSQKLVPVAAPLNIWKIQFDPTCISETELLQRLSTDPAISFAQFNHYVELRGSTPNDPIFPQQWHLFNQGQNGAQPGLDIGMYQAWDLTTGGTNTRGDTIVVAIIDTGIDTTHNDLRPNLWRNHLEIPNNGLDDDGNGYIDDYLGWNSQRLNGNVMETNLGAHGTGVAGVVGAKGNNQQGGTGVNWFVKIMPIVWSESGTEEIILRSFTYAYTQRKLYNQSQGEKGAYVVAINASWGISGLRSDDYPIWCPFFDSLGAQGILSINAAAKPIINTDESGDIPSGCPSPYLIVTTSIDKQGKLINAYGATSVDLAAPGEGIYSTGLRNDFREFSGSSFAAPQVAGAVALLYASPCGKLADLAVSAPAEAARLAQQLILSGINPLESLQGKTSTGGYLRVDKSLRLLAAFCSSDPQTSLQIFAQPNPFHEQLLVPIRSSKAVNNAILEVFNIQGQRLYQKSIHIPANFAGLVEIDTQDWVAGMYLLRLRWAGKEMVVKKVVKI